MPVEQLQLKLQQNKISLSDAIVEALSYLRKKESDQTLGWLVNELQGYSNAMDFYSQPNHGLPDYRIVNGSLRLLGKDGDMADLNHELANRKQYFLSAPISWLEEFASLPGDISVVELPDLASAVHAGHVVLQLPKPQLIRILNEVHARLLLLLDKDQKAQ